MGLKDQLVNIATVVNDQLARLEKEASKRETMYTAAGKNLFFSELAEKYNSEVVPHVNSALQIIESAKEQALIDGERISANKMNDVGYQVALSNTVKLFESPYFKDLEVAKERIAAFQSDKVAVEALRCALLSNEALRLSVQNMPFSYSDELAALEQLKKNFEKLLTAPADRNYTTKVYVVRLIISAVGHFDDSLHFMGA